LNRQWKKKQSKTGVYQKSRKYRLFLQTQPDFALKSLGIHKGFPRLYALNPACVCEISVISFVFRYALIKSKMHPAQIFEFVPGLFCQNVIFTCDYLPVWDGCGKLIRLMQEKNTWMRKVERGKTNC
jgi:hypothetical protein